MASQQTIGALIVKLFLDDSQYGKGVTRAKGSTSTLASQIDSLASGVQAGLVTALKAGTVAMAGLAAASTIVGARFEQQMSAVAAVRGITDKTSDDFRALEERARELGATTAFSATQAAQGMEALARAGLDTEQIITASGDALKYAGGQQIELARAAEIVASSMAQFSLGASESTRITDVFTVATQNSLFAAEDLAQAMKFAGTAGAAAGMKIEEVTASVAQFRNLGLEGSMAGVQFRQSIAALAKPTKEAQDALASLGLTTEDVDPTMNSFRDIMIKLGEAGLDAEKSIQIFSQRAGLNVLKVAKNMSASSQEFDSLLGKLQTSAGATAETYKTMMDNVLGQLSILRSITEEVFLNLFDTIKRPMTDLLKSMVKFMEAVARELGIQSKGISDNFTSIFGRLQSMLESNTEEGAKAIAGFIQDVQALVSAFLPLIQAAAALLPWLREIAVVMTAVFAAQKVAAVVSFVSGLWGMAAAAGGATAAVSALGTALTVASGGTLAMVAAVGTLVVALGAYILKTRAAKDETDQLRRAQERLDQFQALMAKEEVDAAEQILKAQRAKASAIILSGQKISNAYRTELEDLTRLSAAEVVAKVKAGEFVETAEGFRRVTSLMAEGADGARQVALALDETRKSASKSEAEVIRLGNLADKAQMKRLEAERAYGEAKTITNKDVLDQARKAEEVLRGHQQRAVAVAEQEKRAVQSLANSRIRAISETQRAEKGFQNERMADSKIAVQEITKDEKEIADSTLDIAGRLRDEIAQIGLTEEQQREFALAKRREQIRSAYAEQIALEEATGDRLVELNGQMEDALTLLKLKGALDRAEIEKRAKEAEAAGAAGLAALAAKLTDVGLAAEKAAEKIQESGSGFGNFTTTATAMFFSMESVISKVVGGVDKVLSAVSGTTLGKLFDIQGAVGNIMAEQDKQLDELRENEEQAMEARINKMRERGATEKQIAQFRLDAEAKISARMKQAAKQLTSEKATAKLARQHVKGLVDGAVRFANVMAKSIGPFIRAIAERLPSLIQNLIPALFKAFFVELPLALPELAFNIGKAIVMAIPMVAVELAKSIGEVFKRAFGLSKKKGGGGRGSAYTGINYVPATMRMTVHRGEAIVPANRNAERAGGEAVGDPALAGGPKSAGGFGGGGSDRPIELSVFADGRVVDKVLIRANERGQATGLMRTVRKSAGVRVGFSRGRYNRYAG